MRPISTLRLVFGAALALVTLAIGPASAGTDSWTSHGPDGGWVKAIAVDPVTPTKLYAATSGGGILKSTDGGAHWSSTGRLPGNQFATSVAVDENVATTVYAGSTLGGVARSTDGGATWQAVGGSTLTGQARDIVSLATQGSTVYAGSADGLFSSSDGTTWSAVKDQNGSAIHGSVRAITRVPDAAAGACYLAATDQGLATCAANSGLGWPTDTGSTDEFDVAASVVPQSGVACRKQTVYLATAVGVYRRVDRVDDHTSTCTNASVGTWVKASTGLPADVVTAVWLANPIHTALVHDTLYAATRTHGIYKTTSGGDGWSPVTLGLPASGIVEDVTGDPSAPTTVYAGTLGGVRKTVDGGGHWALAVNGFMDSPYVVAFDANTPLTAYAGGAAGVTKTLDGGESWSDVSDGLPNLSVTALAVPAGSPQVVYAGTSDVRGSTGTVYKSGAGVFKTTNGGASWTGASAGLPAGTVGDLAVHPTDPQCVLAATDHGLYRSIDGGGSWALASGSPTDPLKRIAFVGDAPSTAYALSGGNVYRSSDGGATWSLRGSPGSETEILGLAVDPHAPSTVYVSFLTWPFGTAHGVMKSSDGGATWSPMNSGLPAGASPSALAVDPTSGTVYAGTGVSLPDLNTMTDGRGIYAAKNGPAWMTFGGGQTSPNVNDLRIDPASSVLYAATGNGVAVYRFAADVKMIASAAPSSVTVGQNVTYSFHVTNQGPDPAAGARVVVSIPAGASLVAASVAGGSCAGAGPVTCALGTLANGGQANVVVTVLAGSPGDLRAEGTVSVKQVDATTGDNTATAVAAATAPPPPAPPPSPPPPPTPPPSPPPPTVTRCVVPKVNGKTLAAARARIAAAHCKTGRVKKARSKKKKGTVIAQSPAAGRRLPAGSKVNLVVSRGKR